MTPSRDGMQHVIAAARVMVAAAILVAAPVGAQQTEPALNWSGRVAPGQTLQIRNINGAITVERTTGSEVEVVATKRWRRGDPSIVRVEATRYGPNGANALVCAMWGATTCDERGYQGRSRIDSRDGDVHVDFVVRLPDGVRTHLESVNGEISIIGASAAVNAETVNGAIEIQTAVGPVQATSVNGDIDVRIDAVSGSEPMRYETVNGSITLHLPGDFQGELDMETVNGALRNDFPMTVQGRFNPRHIRSRIGGGGRLVTLETVNGSIDLRRRR